MELIEQIFDRMEKRGILFNSIKRYTYMPYDMRYALQAVEAIGKRRSSKFVIDQENRFAYENIIRWVHGDPDFQCLDPETRKPIPGNLKAGIYIAGNTGTGKSWAMEVMSAYALIDNVHVGTNGDNHVLSWNCVRADTICQHYADHGTLRPYDRQAVLCIQDFGSEPAENLYMGNRVDVMRMLIEKRGDQSDKLTLITSNLPISHPKLVQRYGDRVASRLTEMCNYFEIRGTDRRKQRQ